MTIFSRVFLGVMFFCVLCSCSVKEVQVVEPKVINVFDGKNTKTVSLGKIMFQIPHDRLVGRVQGGPMCVKMEPDSTLPAASRGKVLQGGTRDAFYNELKSAGYNIVGDPNSLFDDDSSSMSEIVVSGAIKDMWFELCFPMANFGNMSVGSASTRVEIEWQVYNALDKRVVYKMNSKGSANHKFTNGFDDAAYVLDMAIGNSVQGLLADSGFHKLMTLDAGSTGTLGPLKDGAGVGVNKVASMSSPTATKATAAKRTVEDVRTGVVTVQVGGSWGSGVVISKDGYILTNQHVVADMNKARVLLHDGSKFDAVVVARDARRDVALVKVENADIKPVAVNLVEPRVGDDVYAIGSPKEIMLAGTVTKGVVGGYRQFNGKRWLQADAAINPGNSGGPLVDAGGNVVGISTLGRKDSQGIFFFVPIADALETLKIDVK